MNEIADIVGGGTPSTHNPSYWDGDINWYAPAEMEGKRYAVTSERKITQAGLSNSSAKILPAGRTILFTSRAGIGKVAILQHDAATNQGFQSLVLKDGISPYFIYSMGSILKKKAEGIASGSTFLEISGKMLGNIDITIPISSEQHIIADFFRNLDDLITLHQRKYDKLTKIKKSMLEKMFPKNGSDVPEIRFSGFTDAWEQRKFSDITFPAGEKNKDNLPLESYSITNEAGFVPQDEKFENGGTMREADKRMYYIVTPNSFAYNPARINVGSIGYQNTLKNVIVSSLYEVFKTTDDVNDRLLWHWFKSPDFRKLIEQLQEGGVRLYFYYDKLCMGKVYLPEIDEQGKIGSFFDTLDRLITLHQRELDRLQKIKKSCLEKMFV